MLYVVNAKKNILVYNNGEGAYLAEHSSRRTVESNTGIETAVGHTRWVFTQTDDVIRNIYLNLQSYSWLIRDPSEPFIT